MNNTGSSSKGSENHFPARDCIPLQWRRFEIKVDRSPLLATQGHS